MSLPSARPIAFNRRLRAKWLKDGLRLLADGTETDAWLQHMEDLVRESNSGRDSIQKSMRYLRHVCIGPMNEGSLRSSAVALYADRPSELVSTVLSWGMAIAAYPFLNQVAAILGRMLRIQPEVKLEQLLRKLSETYGERETVRRSGRYALGLITDLGFIKHTDNAGCYVLGPKIKTDNAPLCGWFVRAWFASTGNPLVIDRTAMAGAPSLTFFNAGSLISGAINSGTLIPERLSLSQEVLRLQA